jgi:glycosyltransferase involved in cell wall biosynthesis
VHDLAFLTLPDAAYPTLRVYLERVVPRSARRATRIIAVSERTRQDVLDYLELPEDRVCTVYEGVDPVFRLAGDPALARTQVRSLGVDQPYILTVGTLQPRKNYPRLLEVYARLRRRGLRHRLVIAGARGWMDDPIFRSIDDLHLRDHVTVVRPSDASLVALYQAADAFIYPSLYEGFGLPPLEAMACGVPVACSRASSLPEVAGDAALLFDPTDPEGMEEALRNVLQDDDLRAELRRRGLAQAARFSWDRAAQETVRVYQEAACYA